MRIALIFPSCHRRGGVERIVWETASHLANSHHVYVVARDARELPANVTWLRVAVNKGLPWSAPIRFRAGAKRVVRTLKPDVSISYGAECPTGDVQVVNSVHRAWLERAGAVQLGKIALPGAVRFISPPNMVMLFMERLYFRRPSRLLVPCADQLVRDLERIYGLYIPNNRIAVIHNGFDPELFSLGHRIALREEARHFLGYSPGEIVLVMIANEWRRKGLKVLLDAMAFVRHLPIRLLLAGRTAPTSFAAQIESLGLDDSVRYVGTVDDVALYHAAADVFVLPTQYEAFALAIVEALASGLPVITTDVPGASDLITPGINGLLLSKPEDSRELAGLLQQAMDSADRTRWSENAAASVVGLEWKTLLSRFEAAVLDAMETTRS